MRRRRWCAFCEIRRAARAGRLGRRVLLFGKACIERRFSAPEGAIVSQDARFVASTRCFARIRKEVRLARSSANGVAFGGSADWWGRFLPAKRASSDGSDRRKARLCRWLHALSRGKKCAACVVAHGRTATPTPVAATKNGAPPRVRTGRRACSCDRKSAARRTTRTWAARCRSGSTWSRRG